MSWETKGLAAVQDSPAPAYAAEHVDDLPLDDGRRHLPEAILRPLPGPVHARRKFRAAPRTRHALPDRDPRVEPVAHEGDVRRARGREQGPFDARGIHLHRD